MIKNVMNEYPLLLASAVAGCFMIATMGLLVVAQQPDNQAVAPADVIALTIADMPKDTQATIAPDALLVDEHRKCWLNKTMPVGGDAGVIVHHMKDGSYEVEIRDSKLRWIKAPLTEELRKVVVPVRVLHTAKDEGKKP